MAKKRIVLFTTLVVLSIFIFQGCKTAEEVIKDFIVESVSGFSKNVVSLDPDDKGLTSVNLYFALRNHSDVSGTITSWSFKIRHNIAILVDINSDNYRNYNLETSNGLNVPADDILEFYVNTPLPFMTNALSEEKLSFDEYTPNEVIVDIQVRDEDGNIHDITAKGSYTFEQSQSNESKFNILGTWEITRTIAGSKKARQKMVFVGTKYSGSAVLYNWGSQEAVETGSFMVTGITDITISMSEGTMYWGTMTDPTLADGSLLVPPESRNDKSKTGTWTAKKL